MLNETLLGLCGLAALSLAACAGTPSGPQQKVASKKCEHFTGSLMCSDAEEGNTGSLNSPSTGQPQIYGGNGIAGFGTGPSGGR